MGKYKEAVSINNPDFDLRTPGFVVVHGTVICHMGGHFSFLYPGQKLVYKKHGEFEVSFTDDDHGILKHTTPYGSKSIVFIPPQLMMHISRGTYKSGSVHYPSYQEYFKLFGKAI